jgi:diphthamide synthase (EF-2-diphthine--ammonia ligase)
MKPKEKVLFAWSSGKDSARALYEIKRQGTYKIAALLTTVTEEYDRVSMHGVRRALLEKQAESLGYPLEIIWIPRNSSNEIYEERMKEKLLLWKSKGVSTVAFGDIFLEDLRK